MTVRSVVRPVVRPVVRAVVGGLGDSFSPLLLFATGADGAWYDPSDISTLWQDSARTTPVTAHGDPVGAIDDKSGNGRHMTQATAAARPTYSTDGGYPHLLLDGVDDSVVSAATFTVQLPNYSAGIFSRPVEATKNLLGAVLNSTNYATVRDINTGAHAGGGLRENTIGAVVANAPNNSFPVDTPKVIGSLSVVGTTDISTNGATPTTAANAWLAGTTLSNAAIGISISAAGGAAQLQALRFYGGVVLKADPGSANRAALVRWLGAKVGLAL